MLPFLKPKKLSGTVVVSHENGEAKVKDDSGLIAAAEDLLSAVAMKDAGGVVTAMRAMFDQLEMMEED